MLKEYLRRKNFRRLLAQLRGAKKLRNQSNPYFVLDIIRDLANINLGLTSSDFPKIFVGAHRGKSEVLLRQLLLSNSSKMYSAVFQSFGCGKPIMLPLPSSWRNYLSDNGLFFSNLFCQFLLIFSSINQTLRGLFKFFQIIISSRRLKNSDAPYSAFLNLDQNSLPSSGLKNSYDIISWYKKSIIFNTQEKNIWAQAVVDKEYQIPDDLIISRSIFPRLDSSFKYLKFIFNVFCSIIVCLFGILRGKWWYGYLFNQSVLYSYFCQLATNRLPKNYFFSFSDYLCRPLWTYEAEMMGCSVMMYTYSGNMIDFFRNENKQNSEFIGSDFITWNYFLVWDEDQKSLLKRFCPNAKYQIVGVIGLSDSESELIISSKKFKIAIFDVSPIRMTTYTALGSIEPPYYSIELSLKFFRDIVSAFCAENVELLWKQKRKHDRHRINKGFYKKRDNILKGKVEVVDPDISAIRLIKNCDAVISMPMTSTSTIGKLYGKPSIYYDAFGNLDRNLSNDIQILKTTNEIKEWFNSL